ncbi:MAG: ATP-binding cassette domain-containing protein [Chlorobiaceae bacterium]|nr:ATP-binding cassette domain-containing protein [Chlorobiaceae bacterium]
MRSLLEISDISFGYDKGSKPVLEHLDLDVRRGECIVIKGPSGGGKSTLLRLVCRLNIPLSGTILFKGKNIADIAPPALRSAVSYVSQIPQMTDASVRESLLLPFSFETGKGKPAPSDKQLEQMLDDFYLHGTNLDHSALKLSVGQRQRLSIMRSILTGPEMLLLDEPTSALDTESANMVFSIIERLNTEEGKTLMIVTHSDFQPSVPKARNFILRNGTFEQA